MIRQLDHAAGAAAGRRHKVVQIPALQDRPDAVEIREQRRKAPAFLPDLPDGLRQLRENALQRLPRLVRPLYQRPPQKCLDRDASFVVQPILDFVSNDFTSLMALSQRYGALFAIPATFVESQNAQCRYVPFPDERYCWDVCLVRNQGSELGKGAKLLWEYIENRFAPNGAESG